MVISFGYEVAQNSEPRLLMQPGFFYFGCLPRAAFSFNPIAAMLPLIRSLCLSQARRLRCCLLWRRSLSANAFAALQRVERASSCVARVIAGSVIAAPFVVRRHARNSYAMPVSAINKAMPDAATIGIGNAATVAVSQYGDTPQ